MNINPRCAVLFFCSDPDRDPCAHFVYDLVSQSDGVTSTGFEFDGSPVLVKEHSDGRAVMFARTKDVVSNDYRRYVAQMSDVFGRARWAGVVNWHEGENAPDKVLTVHSTGDVTSGIFAPTSPGIFAALVRAVEQSRREHGLEDFKTWVEATHWSGMVCGGKPEEIVEFAPPIFDLEIGSSRVAWEHPGAAQVLASVCLSAPVEVACQKTFLFCGGTHFEENTTRAILDAGHAPIHVLPNHWLEAGDYVRNSHTKLQACIRSSASAPDLLVLHKGLSAALRTSLSGCGARLGMKVISHRQFRTLNAGAVA